MSEPVTGIFKIVSLLKDAPTSINPALQPYQAVRLDLSLQDWKLSSVGEDVFYLKIGGYDYSGVLGDVASVLTDPAKNVEWHATYRVVEKAYTIEPANDRSLGWTVIDAKPDVPVIKVAPIKAKYSDPPQYFADQLFRFVKVA